MTFDDDFDKIVDELSKEKPKPPPKNTIVEIIRDVEVATYGYIGLLTSGKLSSQRQIKLRKSFVKWAGDMVKMSNPDANIIMTNQIYLKHLKEKKLEELS